MSNPTVFISYSHDSPEHADRVLDLADRLIANGIDCTLDQYETTPPEGWPRWMDRHIRQADFVLMICTDTYCRRVMGEEEPGRGRGVKWEGSLIYQHIYQADTTNTRFIPVLFDPAHIEHIPTPLQGATHYTVDSEEGYEALYRRLTDQPLHLKPKLGKLRRLPPRERQPDFLAAEPEVSIGKLPISGEHLFGREQKLQRLDQAWADPETNVLSLVAWGGVGKTALLNHWLAGLAREHYRGAKRVYGWSFYSQGTRETAASADQFTDAALRWFGDPDPTTGSPWDKGERLARLVRQARALLLLDGLEPLQYPPGPEAGKLKDPALAALLRELAAANPGLCVITTRQRLTDIDHYCHSTAPVLELEHLSDEAGAALLSALGVQGPAKELRQASREFGGHGLALNLLGTYLRDVCGGDVRRRGEVSLLEEDTEQGGHARRVMVSYETWLGESPELAILRLLGLYDRPADGPSLAALRAAPVIPGLTDQLFHYERGTGLFGFLSRKEPTPLDEDEWKRALARLRQARLLAEVDPVEPNTLDAHPLVREHFGQQLQEAYPDAWREGNNRLYEYYKKAAKEYPDTLAEMAPLFSAVAHGCAANRHQEALDEVFYRRMDRGQAFVAHKLGALGATLAALSGFFDPPWRRPVAGLSENHQGYVSNVAGFCLRALGRLAEAAQPLQASLETATARNNLQNAAIAAGNLSELYLTLGDLAAAVETAKQAVELADRSGDAYHRIGRRTTLANALHQVGKLTNAKVTFQEAEHMQKVRQPYHPLLYSSWGFYYCDLLLTQGKHREVQNRIFQTLEWTKQEGFLFEIALEHLALGRSHLVMATQAGGRGNFSQAAHHLNRAVGGLRQAGQQQELPRGLLARAALHRLQGNFERAQRDLDEARLIAERGGMRLHLADVHLESARLALAQGDKDETRQHLATAREMIEAMGYHRRDPEVAELEAAL